MTGFGRTGKTFACEHANVIPDFICCSKGLSSGWLPISTVLCSTPTYQLFYDDYETGKAFMHSNTYCGNALAAAAALATLKVYEQEDTFKQAKHLQSEMMDRFKVCAQRTGRLKNLRGLGGMVAAELKLEPEQESERIGYQIYQEALKRGVLLRPLGNTLYWFPPLNISTEELDHLSGVTEEAILAILKK
jgi:adenosylmethionine-8-amino-7-oxononanoate aminotransferase